MKDYYTAQICLNGHVVSSYSENLEKHCSQCGAVTTQMCFECKSPIRGVVKSDLSYMFNYSSPNYCHECGQPFPWTKTALDSMLAIIEDDDEITEDDCSKIMTSLSDIIVETPKTQLASIRLKKALLSVGKFTAEGIRQFAIDFGCELAKKSLGLK